MGLRLIVPIPIPASVVGLVLLFVLLCLKVIKLEQVETLGTSLTSLIGFLFVPSGISVMNSLGVMRRVRRADRTRHLTRHHHSVRGHGPFSQLILSVSQKRQKTAPEKQTVRRSNQEKELVQD